MNKENKYCNSLTEYSRFKTRVVKVGDKPLGGNNPIRIQSMTTTNTLDTTATVKQTIRIVNAGADYVRITAPSINEAKNLAEIKKELRKRGYNIPLIADIHFTPNAAEIAARIVEKVRINPGNYADKKKFQTLEYTDSEYELELERIAEKFLPLIKICKEYGTALRIGVNHGSLSDRILSRYGDTPAGMVESALEFVRICEENNFFDIVLSMKSSNPQVMVQAYRLLVNKMIKEGMNYPLHLGVTEAGEGADGRIKSAIGIGALLEDGLGDTIRVSLTEPPENEIPVARKIVEFYSNRKPNATIPAVPEINFNPFEYNRRSSFKALNIGGGNPPAVVADLSSLKSIETKDFSRIGYDYNAELDKWEIAEAAADLLFLGDEPIPEAIPNNCGIILNYNSWEKTTNRSNCFPLCNFKNIKNITLNAPELLFVKLELADLFKNQFEIIANKKNLVFVLEATGENELAELRRAFFELTFRNIANPTIIKTSYNGKDLEKAELYSSIIIGSLLIDGFGDGVWLDFPKIKNKSDEINKIAFGILQAARVRITKTEYIACPSCGRTLFDLVEVTNRIRQKTEHLKGLKIGVMGCIVNGPGEMADADYGYVGSGVGKITLYRGKEIVKKNVPASLALDVLIDLIKRDGKWTEPKN